MAEKFLVEEKVISVRKEHFDGVGVVSAIDRGCTLTKILYSSEYDSDHYNLHFALFKNQHFEHALEYMKEKGTIVQKPGAKLHVTGTGCDMHRDMIRDKLGFELEFIDEFLTQSRGTHWLIANCESDLYYPKPDLSDSGLQKLTENNFIKTFMDSFIREVGEQDLTLKFPCLVLFIGSGSGILRINENGMADMLGGVWLAGRSFLGLAKLLLGTSDYDEIMKLAAAGDRTKIDTQVKDVLANDANSPYGKFPADMPIFSFGKLSDIDITLNPPSREDIANSLAFSFASNAFSLLYQIIKTTRIPRAYVGGNFFRSEVIRTEMAKQLEIFGGDRVIKLNFVKTGHTGAVGAMLSNPDDLAKFMTHAQKQKTESQ